MSDEPKDGSRAAAVARTAVVWVCVLLACVSLLVAVLGVWVGRSLLDTENFVAATAAIVEDPAVENALTDQLTTQIMDALAAAAFFEEQLPGRRDPGRPAHGALEGFVHDQVEAVLSSERLTNAVTRAIEVAHGRVVTLLRDESELVEATDTGVTVDLEPVVDAAVDRIAERAPQLAGLFANVVEPQNTVIVIDDGGRLASLQGLMRAARQPRHRRRRGDRAVQRRCHLHVAGAPADGFRARAGRCAGRRRPGVVLVAVGNSAVALPETVGGQDAMRVAVDQLVGPLRDAATALLVALLVAAGALFWFWRQP